MKSPLKQFEGFGKIEELKPAQGYFQQKISNIKGFLDDPGGNHLRAKFTPAVLDHYYFSNKRAREARAENRANRNNPNHPDFIGVKEPFKGTKKEQNIKNASLPVKVARKITNYFLPNYVFPIDINKRKGR
tara:strand:+ start:118 stop:510 length:393 start_codon:yes stop_codon:yes gene_type:complete